MEQVRGGLAGKLATCAAALALVASMIVIAPPAQALDTGGETAPGSITVHKYKTQTASNIPGTGDAGQTVPHGAEPMAGVQFTLYRLDTAKVEGATTGTPAVTKAPTEAGVAAFLATYQDTTFQSQVKTTDAAGLASWKDLPFAYYLLVETDAGGAGVTKAAPDIVTLPYAQGATGGTMTYIKDVHVYPKNISTDLVEKTVVDQPDVVKPGDTLEYQITFSVPAAGKIVAGATMTGSVVDTLPKSATGQPTITVNTAGEGDGAYTVSALTQSGAVKALTPANLGVSDTSATDGQITWTVTPALAAEIEALNVDAPADPVVKVQIGITATVNDNAFAAGLDDEGQPSISNTATVTVRDSDGALVVDGVGSTTDPIPTPGFQFAKVDTAGEPITANPATFKLAATYEDATAGTFLTNGGVDLTATTSAADGLAVFSGLNAGKLRRGPTSNAYTAVADAVAAAKANPGVEQTVELWIVETQAPNGYRILQAPQKVTLTISKATAGAMVKTTVVNGPLSIVNTHNGEEGGGNFALPNTGGMGAIAFIVLGIALVAVATTYFARSRRNKGRRS